MESPDLKNPFRRNSNMATILKLPLALDWRNGFILLFINKRANFQASASVFRLSSILSKRASETNLRSKPATRPMTP
jgi:hypothetical protein